MDFLEGALLGSLWTDTDYEDREHKGLRLLLSATFWLGILAMAYFINFRIVSFAPLFNYPWLLIFFGLLLLSPLLSFLYYKLPVILRFVILAVQLLKYAAGFLFVYELFVPHLRINLERSATNLLNFFNNTIGRFIEFFTERYETFGMLFSAAVLAVVALILFLIGLIIVIYLPQIILILERQVQNLWDKLAKAAVRLISGHRRKLYQSVGGPPRSSLPYPEKHRSRGTREGYAAGARIGPSSVPLPPRDELFRKHAVGRPHPPVSSAAKRPGAKSPTAGERAMSEKRRRDIRP